MHLFRTQTAVKPLNILGGDTLSEVGFDGIDADVEEAVETRDVPCAGFGVGEVYDTHAGLPEIPLEYVAVFALEKVTFGGRELEDGGGLAKVGVNPYADLLDETYYLLVLLFFICFLGFRG